MIRTTNIAALRRDFPILETPVGGAPLTYLDSAATTQKPHSVIEAIRDYYLHDNANVHRAAHTLADRATSAFESARRKVQAFVAARHSHEIIWTRGTTESINLVANSFAASTLQPSDEILISVMEHHSNIVPWQLVAQRCGARLTAIDVTDGGELDLDDFARKLSSRTKIVAVGHVSNALGTINPVAQITAAAHAVGAIVLIDGAQAAAHLPIDVVALDCDFYALSGHKMFGPTGIGVLYGKERLLDAMPPWQGGGEMIETVTIERTTYNQLPYKFEAGTPDIAGAIGLGAAIDYLDKIEPGALRAHESRILALARSRLRQLDGVRIIGDARESTAAISFVVDGSHPQDIGTLLDQQSIAVRTGHHCAMPLMQRLGISGTVRASFCLYNSELDVERLMAGIESTYFPLGRPMTIQTFDPTTAVITMTPAAAEHIRAQLTATGRGALRLAVAESGCSGYMYELGYTDAALPSDLICDAAPGVRVYIAVEVLPLVQGTQIDYVRQGLNASLRFLNPNAQSECGCGESFSVTKPDMH